MAHQLHYTSASAGLSGGAGFQFVAASPDAGQAVRHAVAPYLGYRPPPSAPAQPTADEVARLPVSFCFDRGDGLAILTQCRYLGTDYSGRHGNFLGHAVVASISELGLLRPIELWRSPLWAGEPADTALPQLVELTPGDATDPETVLARLAGGGERAYELLAELVDAALDSLDGRGGQVVLVADHVDTVATWIAAISYSLPLTTAYDLSFVTYTADPDRARQHVVGTTPDSLGGVDGPAYHLDAAPPSANRARQIGRYARTVVEAWRERDLAAIDALCELLAVLSEPGGEHREQREAVAALFALCRGASVTEAEARAVADLVAGHPERLPQWAWGGLAAAPADVLGFDLARSLCEAAERTNREEFADRTAGLCVALALRRRDHRQHLPGKAAISAGQRAALAPTVATALRDAADLEDLLDVVRLGRRYELVLDASDLRAGVSRALRTGPGDLAAVLAALPDADRRAAALDGAVAGMADADVGAQEQVFAPPVCDLLVDRDWHDAPRVGAVVLGRYGMHHPDRRVGVTGELIDLGDRRLLPAAEVDHWLGRVWDKPVPALDECLRLVDSPTLPEASARRPAVLALASRAWAASGVTSDLAVKLAHQVRTIAAGKVEVSAVADAELVLARQDMVAGKQRAADGLLRWTRWRDRAPDPRATHRIGCEGKAVATAAPQIQASVLAQLDAGRKERAALVAVLDGHGRGDTDLVEVAVRLWRDKQPDPALRRKVARLINRKTDTEDLRFRLGKRDPALASAFDLYVAELRRPRLPTLWRRHRARRG